MSPVRPAPAARRGRQRLVPLLAALWLFGAGPLRAADEAAAPQQRVQVEQKLRLIATLLGDGPASRRIAASGHSEAIAHLDEARVHLALANDQLNQGLLAEARKSADEALRHLSHARRLVPDVATQQAASRRRYQEQLASTERLLEAWRSRQSEVTGAAAQARSEALTLLTQAREQATQQRYDEAGNTLGQAEQRLLAGMAISLGSSLDYTERATTPAEAVRLAQNQLRALFDLVPLALRDLRPSADAVSLIERYGQTARELEAQAQQLSQAGEHEQALTTLRNAVLQVQRALTTAGLTLPQPTGNSP